MPLQRELERNFRLIQNLKKKKEKETLTLNFIVAPCINNIKHFIVQLMHTNYKSCSNMFRFT